MDINKMIHSSTYQSQCEAVFQNVPSLSGWTFKDYSLDMTFSGFVIINLWNPKNDEVTIRLFGSQPNWKKAITEALVEHEPSLADCAVWN